MNREKKAVAILGPTAVGKSELGVTVAHKFAGEVISADSRQVYRGLDIGTGKITAEEMQGIPHHLLDIRNPNEQYTASEFKDDAFRAIDDIHTRDKLPILLGGTGFFISAVVDNLSFPDVPPDPGLREKLEQKTTAELFELLKERDTDRAQTIDPHNRRRLVRALEIAEQHESVPPIEAQPTHFETLRIGLSIDSETLRDRIRTRLKKRIEAGMIEEVRHLHENGLSYERMDELGLEYRYLAHLLKGELTLNETKEKLETKIWQYAKRQMTWFKRDPRIVWFSPDEHDEVFEKVSTFLHTT